MKKFCFTILTLLMSVSALHAETLTLVTYYAAPMGAFQELYLKPFTEEFTNPCEVGTIFFNVDGRMMVCETSLMGNGNWDVGTVWKQEGTNVFLSEDSLSDLNLLGIGTKDPEFTLTLKEDATLPSEDSDTGIIAKGRFGSGSTLGIAGAGSKFIWYPRKAALRAGEVTGSQWDNVNIGEHSVAFGYNTLASGQYSVATGNQSLAKGVASVAMGTECLAAGESSVAMAYHSEANGVAATALGAYVQANGDYSVAFVRQSRADGICSVAMGNQSVAAGQSSFAAGSAAIANAPGSVALGSEAKTTENIFSGIEGTGSIAMGMRAETAGYAALAIGAEVQANADYAIVTGYLSEASEENSIAMGSDAIAEGVSSVALGTDARILPVGEFSVAMGTGLEVSDQRAFIFGRYNDSRSLSAGRRIFAIANGSNDSYRNNVVQITEGGSMGLGMDPDVHTPLSVGGLPEYADNAAALAAGHTVGAVYRTGDVLKIVH